MREAARSVPNDETVQVTRIMTTVPLSTSDVKQMQFIADHDHCEGHGGVGVGELIHHGAVNRCQPVDFLSDKGGEPFRGHSHGAHHGGGVEGAPAVKHDTQVDQHTDSYKKVRDEKSVAHKFKAPHQSGPRRDEAVEHQPGEEGAEHPSMPMNEARAAAPNTATIT